MLFVWYLIMEMLFLQAWVVSFLNITPGLQKAFSMHFWEGWKAVCCCAHCWAGKKHLLRWLKLLWLSLFTSQPPCKAFKEQGWFPASFPILSENNYCQRKLILPWWNLGKWQSWLMESCNFCLGGDSLLELAMWPPTTAAVLERPLKSVN